MAEPSSPRLPDLVIAGVTKAGTTSLFHYLAQHPDVGVPDVKEVDHYAPLVEGREPPSLEAYAAHFAGSGDRRVLLEASPRYFIGGPPLVDRLVADLASPKVLVVLRDPVARMWSSYTYKRSKDRLPDDVDLAEFVRRCRSVHERGLVRDPGHAAYRTLAVGVYADFLPAWLDGLGPDLRVVFADDLREPVPLLRSLCEWVGLDPAPVAGFDLSARNATFQPRSRALRRAALAVNERLGSVLPDGARRGLRRSYQRVNAGALAETFDPAVRAELEAFYAPTLPPLREMLVRHGATALPAWLG
ncbi:hypothetical protein GCM10011519_22930 [Marmoricola endophyticus]|uniref:Sulfotransferase domain-containing protein n=1 Tax=Marmoricola endophyticus TaxID=2040280 RepID=A0A917F422_9ACTN|nr:sulfotransferase domain-containing protein [Marmoricola endophyticus]GGF48342.1 hypothetical protein GCM10011519_22930 [Marmoricola endophyticus]